MVSAVLAGCGAMSKTWLEAAAQTEGLTIAGLVDIDPQRAEARAREFGLDKAVIGSDLDAVLKRAPVDIVLDVVVPEARRDIALTAFRHGCHLLTEKPLADTREHALEILDAARRADRIHAVAQNRRHVANVRRIRRFLDSGAIGKPTSVHCDFFIAPHFGGFREKMSHVLLLDMAIHTFDAARYMIDGEPRAVYCQEWEPRNSWYRQGSSAIAIFDMAGGAVFTYRGSWCAEGLRTSWESVWRIVGEHGSLTWDGFDDVRAEITTGVREGNLEKPQPVVVPPLDPRDRIGGHRGVLQDFLSAVLNGGRPETDGTDNIKSFVMTLSAIESAETGRRVDIRM
jgi:predicted dehydrogenase